MKKIEKRTVVCLILTLILLLGVGLFVVRFFLNGGSWASFAANRHLYNSQGQLSVGRVLDRDGDLLSWMDEDGNRQYYANQTVRMATLHAVGLTSTQTRVGDRLLTVLASLFTSAELAADERPAGSALGAGLTVRYASSAIAASKAAVPAII